MKPASGANANSMPEFPREYLVEINRVLSSVRASLDFANSNSRTDKFDPLMIREAYFRFEEVRFDFRRSMGPAAKQLFEYQNALPRLQKKLLDLVHFPPFFEIATQLKIRPTPFSARLQREMILHPGLYEREVTVADGIRFLIESIDRIPDRQAFLFEEDNEPRSYFDARAIRKVVPSNQGLAPLKFDIVGEKIIISPQSPQLLEEDHQSAASAKDSLLANGSEIIGELEKSNCDRRLLENIKDLQQKLEAEADIIKLGLANIGTGIMCGMFSDELPNAVCSMIEAHNVGISMYVGQFVEWRKFSEKAALSEITNEDTATISGAAEKVIGELEKNPNLTDPEVPRSLRALNSLLADHKGASRRAAFAVLRSIENLVIKIFNYGTDMIEKTAEKIVDMGSTAAARIMVITMFTVALTGAVALTPIAAHIPNSKWISKAIEVVQKQIDKLE